MRKKIQEMSTENITVHQAYDKFMQEKRALNLSGDTLATYKLHISNFISICDLWDCSVQQLNKEIYQWWIEDLQEDTNKRDVTVASYARSVRCFLYWLQENGYMEVCDLKLPKYQQTIKMCYTNEELSIILEKPNICREVEYQTWVFINFICATGMRLSSALGVHVSDISKKEHAVYVQLTKNKKAQIFYISDEMLSILQKYILKFELKDHDWLFCSAEKTPLAKRTIQGNVADYNRRRGVKKTSIHLMRHTFAKNYYMQTKDMYSLSKILGHSSISTTEKYLTDLGISLADTTAYNPQQLFGSGHQPRKRRSRAPQKQ